MADQVKVMDMSFVEAGDVNGKIVNVYDSYAHALAHKAAGLKTVKDVNRLTGGVGDVIPQTAKTAGPEIDLNGKLVIALEDGTTGRTYWLNSTAGRFGGPMRIDLVASAETESSSSESSSSESSESSESS